VSTAWVTLVALAYACSHGRRVARHLAAGRIVIFDRYVLDSFVRLRFFYGHRSRFRVQRLLIAALSPRPRAAFYLEVDQATSLARKADKWSASELETQAQLYREESERLGVLALDGPRAADDLAAEIAAEVWRRVS
jgi:thymidylate kinase